MSNAACSALAFIHLPFTGLHSFSLCLLLPITSEQMLCSDVMIGILQNHLISPCVLRLLGEHLGIRSRKAYGKSTMCLPGIAFESNKHQRQSSLPPTRYSLAEVFTESVPLWWASRSPFNEKYTAVCIDKTSSLFFFLRHHKSGVGTAEIFFFIWIVTQWWFQFQIVYSIIYLFSLLHSKIWEKP